MSHAVNADKIQLLYRHYGEEEGGRTIDLGDVRLWLSDDGTELVGIDVPPDYELWRDGQPLRKAAVDIYRVSSTDYRVARVSIRRSAGGTWQAWPSEEDPGRLRPLWETDSLEDALELAAQGIEMFRSV